MLSISLKNHPWSSDIPWEPISFNRSSNLKKSMVPCSWLPRLPLECCLFFLNFTFRIRFGFTNGVGEPG